MKLKQLNYQHEMEELEVFIFKQIVYLKKQSSFLNTAHFAKRNSTTIWMQLDISVQYWGKYFHKSNNRAIHVLSGRSIADGQRSFPPGVKRGGEPRTLSRCAAAGNAGAGAHPVLRMFPQCGHGSWG